METSRRNFLCGSVAAATFGAIANGQARALDRERPLAASQDLGWSQLPSILANIVPPTFPSRDFVITAFGASGQANVDCSAALNATIEACHRSGGGRVVVPSGLWLSNGPIHLLSNVNLYLESGSTIVFGTNPEDYLPLQLVRWQGIRCYNYSPLIYSYQQKNIAITGSGTFNGQGSWTWSNWTDVSGPDWALLQQMAFDGVPLASRSFGTGHYLRPGFFEPYECQNILVQGVTFEGSPFWTIHPTFCSNVTIQDVIVLPGALNDDGCDPDSCQNVLITGCNFWTVDDNVSLKAGLLPDASGLPDCENIVVQNCNCLQSDWSALTMGADAGAFIRNVFMENCSVNNCLNAHYIKSWDNLGGGVENVYIRSTTVGTCHHVMTLQPDAYASPATLGAPLLSNINLQDVTCANSLSNAFLFQGDARLPIENVNLSNIVIAKSGGTPVFDVTNTAKLTAVGISCNGSPVALTKR